MLSCPELLSPAGSLEALKYAVMYGADAVYCALPRFGMRAAPVNLTIGELHDGCIFAHARGKKVYLTLNNLPTNDELSELPQYIKDAAEARVDAFIIADLGVLSLAKQYAPDVDVHLSTQAGITWATCSTTGCRPKPRGSWIFAAGTASGSFSRTAGTPLCICSVGE